MKFPTMQPEARYRIAVALVSKIVKMLDKVIDDANRGIDKLVNERAKVNTPDRMLYVERVNVYDMSIEDLSGTVLRAYKLKDSLQRAI